METPVLLTVRKLVKYFDISGSLLDQMTLESGRIRRKKTVVKALNGVSFDIHERETVSVVGESGCGKSTLARTVVGLYPPESGEVYYREKRIDTLSGADMKPYRTRMQMVFQDPYASLNPRMSVRKILEEPIRFHGVKKTPVESFVIGHSLLRSRIRHNWPTLQ